MAVREAFASASLRTGKRVSQEIRRALTLTHRVLDLHLASRTAAEPFAGRGVVPDAPSLDLERDDSMLGVREDKIRFSAPRPSRLSWDEPGNAVERHDVVRSVVPKSVEEPELGLAFSLVDRPLRDHPSHAPGITRPRSLFNCAQMPRQGCDSRRNGSSRLQCTRMTSTATSAPTTAPTIRPTDLALPSPTACRNPHDTR